MSFTTYKLFVFKTKGNWLQEYFRSCMVYASMALIGIVLLWGMVDHLHIKIWLAQGLVIAATVVISYIGHARFTFRLSTKNSEKL
jgi:putative flippase GtrA